MTCPIPQCAAQIRWHNRLCAQHARHVPPSLQMDIYRLASRLVVAKSPFIIREYGRKYRQCLSQAVAAVMPS
jgi:hypothetical protein